MTDVIYGVYQTNNGSSNYDGTGFKSSRSSSGSFLYQFDKPGTYYFSSGFVDQYDVVELKGKVVVEPASSMIVNIGVKVNGK